MSPVLTVRQLVAHAQSYVRSPHNGTLVAERGRALAPMWLPLPSRWLHATTVHAPRSRSELSASSLTASCDINVFIADTAMVNNSLFWSYAYYFLRRRSSTPTLVRQSQITRSKLKLPFAYGASSHHFSA